MCKYNDSYGVIAGAILIVSAFVDFGFNKWIIATIGILMVAHLLFMKKPSSNSGSGQAVFMDRKNKIPSRNELKSTIKRKPVSKKSVAKKTVKKKK